MYCISSQILPQPRTCRIVATTHGDCPGAGLNPGKPVMLFQDNAQWLGHDAAPDGRLVVARAARDKVPGTQINVVLNWFDELKQEQQK